MTITMQGLLHADTARLRAAAERWATLVTRVDATAGDLIDVTRDLPHHWAGTGGEAAQRRSTRLQAQLGNPPSSATPSAGHSLCSPTSSTTTGSG